MDAALKDRIIFCLICLAAIAVYYAGVNHVAFIWILSNGFSYIGIFFHELGHTLFNWLYGYPALPAFDFVNGGGITLHQDRVWVLQYVVWAALAFVGYQLWRADAPYILIMYGVFAAFIFITSLMFVHEDVWLFMGVGTEAVIGSFLLARAYHNVLLVRKSERWLNALIGGHMVYGVLYLAWNLMYDAYFAANYAAQKGAHRFGDLHRIQDNQYLTTINPVCWTLIEFTFFCIALNMFVLWVYKQTSYDDM